MSDLVPYEKAIKISGWKEAMLNELAAIERNKTWELTSLPPGKKIIGEVDFQKQIQIKW